jgi:alkylation response protein AidB-like acyl-CoA dehydrogenase
VDFQLTEDQRDLRDGIRKLCAGVLPMDKLRATDNLSFWPAFADAGVFSLRTELGLGMCEAALVFEELGRALVPGPTIWTHLAAGLVDADRIAGGVVRAPGPAVVEHLAFVDDLVIVDDDGVWLLEAAAVSGDPGEAVDPFTPVTIVPQLAQGSQIGGPEVAARWRLEGAVLAAAQLVGIASALVDLTVAYTKERKQFGRPVGSFQALKHTMADMLTRAELARTQVYAAAVHLDDASLGGTERAVSSAKVVAGHAALANGPASIQCHGGMGYTWEVDSHLYLKRAWVLDALFGSGDDHAVAVSDYLAGEEL